MRRKPIDALRVPLNCLISPATKEELTGIQNETRESQGEIVDRAISLLALGEEVEPKPIKKQSRAAKAVAERAASDVMAQEAERNDIDYTDTESTPGLSVARLGPALLPRREPTIDAWRARGIRPKGDKSR